MQRSHSPQFSYQLTRIAPTPSGFLHLGNVYSFAITACIAARFKSKLLLRIDDLDSDRTTEEFLDDIFDTLRYLDIEWQTGPANRTEHCESWSQRTRLPFYEKALEALLDSGKIFACRCSRARQRDAGSHGCVGSCEKEMHDFREPEVSWRVRTDHSVPISMRGLKETMTFTLPASMRHFIVRRRDGIPAYQLCSLVDDHIFGTDLVVRGHDLLESTLAQLYLAGILGFKEFCSTSFYHHPLLTDAGGRKLSKSAGDTSIRSLRRQGLSAREIYKRLGETAGLVNIGHWRDLHNTGNEF